MRAGIYARISEDRDETQLGVKRQIEDAEALAAQRSWDVVERYVDNDLSAWKGGKRPEYLQMLADIEAGHIEAVVVYHSDRLHRQPRELEDFIILADRKGTALASVTGDMDLATGDGRFKARILGAVAAKESDDKSRRIKRKMLQLAQEGAPKGGGSRPFGFEEDRVTVRESEAEIIRELAGRLLAGEPLRGLARNLRERGIHSPTGKTWQPGPLGRMLMSARIAGQRQHRGEIIGPARWEAIITPEQAARIRSILKDPSRRAQRAPRKYLLKGLLRCEQCGAALVSRPRDDRKRRYVCATGPGFVGCGKTYVLAEPIEEHVITSFLWEYIDSPEFTKVLREANGAEGNEAQDRADAIAVKLDELAQAYAADQIGMREWLAARDPLQRQLDQAQRCISRQSRNHVLSSFASRGEAFAARAAALNKRWAEASFEQRHAWLSAAIVQIDVGPGRRGYNRFDPERFTFTFRQ